MSPSIEQFIKSERFRLFFVNLRSWILLNDSNEEVKILFGGAVENVAVIHDHGGGVMVPALQKLIFFQAL
jgi:hypothetical protein